MKSHVLGIVGAALIALSLLMGAATPLVATAAGRPTPALRQPVPGAPGGQPGPWFGRPRMAPR